MQKKIILLIVLIIIVIGVWLYLFFTSPAEEEPKVTETPEKSVPLAPLPERYEFEGVEYEIVSTGGPVYDIITGEITREQAEALAEKIIGDILVQEPDVQEITLLFYSDLITLGAGEVDIAEISWTPEGINVEMQQWLIWKIFLQKVSPVLP